MAAVANADPTTHGHLSRGRRRRSETERSLDVSSTDSTSTPHPRVFYFSQDRVHLVRIAIVTSMGLLTLLVVTLLLHEAVLADQRIVNSPTKHKLIDKHKLHKALQGMAGAPPSRTPPETTTTTSEAPPSVPPTPMRYMMDDEEDPEELYRRWRRRRRKSHKRNGQGPFRVSLPLPKGSYDPYDFGEEEYSGKLSSSSSQSSSDRKRYNYPSDAKSIQEIIHFLMDGKQRGRLPTHGVRLKGLVKNLDMSDPVGDMFPQETRGHENRPASNNPLEDFRMAGDPKEVNNVLMGFSTNRGKGGSTSDPGKPKTVSLMLDIHPMGGGHGEQASASSHRPSRPRRPPRRKFRRNRPRDHDDYHSRDEMLHARPSYHHNDYARPHHAGSDVAKNHQIMLHLNFFPSGKKKQNEVDLGPGKTAGLTDLAPSPRDVDLRPPKTESPPFKAESIPSVFNDPSINVFNRHRYGSSTATVVSNSNKGQPVPSSQINPFEDHNVQLFHEVKNHRLTPVELVGFPEPQLYQDVLTSAGMEQSTHLEHPTYPMGGLTYGLPVHRFIADESSSQLEPRDNTLKV